MTKNEKREYFANDCWPTMTSLVEEIVLYGEPNFWPMVEAVWAQWQGLS